VGNESVWGWSIYDSLLSFNDQGVIVPNVAESFSMSPEGVWTFKIRKGIKFHNGDPLTAEDVKFSVDRFGDTSVSRNPWSQYISAGYNKVDSIVVDDYTYQFKAARPEIHQSIAFAWTRILPKKAYEAMGADAFRKNPIGSGPWKFVELVSKTSIKLEANTQHWREVPYYQNVIELMVPEQSTRIAMLKAGDVDIALAIDYDKLVELKKAGFRTEAVGFPVSASISFQGTWLPGAGPTGDIRVRQAMSYALNRPEINATWYQGLAQPGGQFFMHRGSFGWTDALIPETYNLDKAKALLKEAGYPEKFDNPTITIFATAPAQDYLLMLMGYWEKAGLKVELKVVDASVYFGKLFARTKEGDENVGWAFPWTSGSFFNNTYHSANMYTTRGIHGTSNDVKATEMYDAYLKEQDIAKAEKLWAEFQAYVKTLYINIGVAEVEPAIAVAPTLGKFTGENWKSLNDAYDGIQHP
jgi:peptide/nickel transport system substrate-binding protein